MNALFDTPFQVSVLRMFVCHYRRLRLLKLAMKLPKEKKLSVPMMLALQPVSEVKSSITDVDLD